jgi:HIRAN domain
MSQPLVVRLRGGSHSNEDGTDRQRLIAECKAGCALTLRAEPGNPHDRHAVAVFDAKGQQLGYLPSDARDASAILRGESISATVDKRIGGRRWWHQLFGIKRHYGLLIRLNKAPIDWKAHSQYREVAQAVDTIVADAVAFEKATPSPDEAIAQYKAALAAVIQLNSTNPTAAAHRYQPAPINRLTMLLIRQKQHAEARKHYAAWVAADDPIGLTKADRDAVQKRLAKLPASAG